VRSYPTIEDIHEAQARLKPHIRHTPLLRAEKIQPAVGCQLYLKPETLQITGAFKIRGALNKALSLPREAIANGLIATSSGNHAQGIAYAALLAGSIKVRPDEKVCAVLSGGNWNLSDLADVYNLAE
jgi:threonine dehydratase